MLGSPRGLGAFALSKARGGLWPRVALSITPGSATEPAALAIAALLYFIAVMRCFTSSGITFHHDVIMFTTLVYAMYSGTP